MKYYLGLNIGGTNSSISIGNSKGEILFRESTATDHSAAPGENLQNLFRLGRKILNNSPEKPVSAGISCGGPLNSSRGIILSPPNLPGWDKVPVKKIVEDEFGITATLLNDADACALAEWKFGAGKGAANLVFLTFGTGMGGGLILNNRLYTGASGLGGEIGHIRMEPDGPMGYGKKGSFEGFCSGGGIAAMGRTRALELIEEENPPAFCPDQTSLNKITAANIAEAALNGDTEALEIFRKSGEYLGRGLSVLIDILNPERIIIGSIFSRMSGFMIPQMMKVLEKECLPGSLAACRILPAGLGEKIGDTAAITTAMYPGKS